MEKAILGIVPGLMSTALVGENLKLFDIGKKGKSISSKKLMKVGVTNMVGIGIIGSTSSMINKL